MNYFQTCILNKITQKHSTILSHKQRWYQNVNLSVGPTKAHQQHLKLKNDKMNFLYCLQPK